MITNIQCSSDISELGIRILYARILRIRVCLYAHICAYIRLYMSLCCAFPYVSLYEALLVKQDKLFLWQSKRLQSEICIFRVSITSQIHTFLWHLLDLKLWKMRRKLKQSLEVPILTRELYIFTRTGLCFGTPVSASRLRNVLYLALHWEINPRRKNYISGYIWHRSFIQTAKCSLLD